MQKFINLFGIAIPSYAFFAVIGFCAAILFAFFRNKDQIIKWSAYYLFIVFSAVGMLLGSKLLFFITVLPTELTEFNLKKAFFLFLNSGFVFYGGLLGAIGGGLLSTKISHEDSGKTLNIFIPPFVLFHAFGRIGCFFSGCCYGIPWKYGIAMQDTPDIKRVPVQLMECAAEMIICIVILLKERRKSQQYDLVKTYLILYAPARFLLEFLRGDTARGIWWGGLSTSQYISIIIFAVSGILIVIDIVKGKRKQKCDEGS